jgi:cytochrome c556
MTDQRWAALQAKAEAVQQAALEIATMDPLIVAKPGVKISDEGIPGGHTAAMVQERFDKDPAKLRDLANALARHTGDLAAAAQAHDADKAGPLIDQLDGVCETCHLEYWYPDQKALVEQILARRPEPAVTPL